MYNTEGIGDGAAIWTSGMKSRGRQEHGRHHLEDCRKVSGRATLQGRKGV